MPVPFFRRRRRRLANGGTGNADVHLVCITCTINYLSRYRERDIINGIMPISPKADHLPRLCETFISHGSPSPLERNAIEYLFRTEMENLKKQPKERVRLSDMDLATKLHGDAGSGQAARTLITRLRTRLKEFYADNPIGRKERFSVIVDLNDGYSLSFPLNDPPPMADQFVSDFWAPYTQSDRPVRLYYPEPAFFRDSHSTMFHNLLADPRNPKESLSYLGIEEMSQNFSFVSSGLVKSILVFFDLFQRRGVPLLASPLRASATFPEADEDIIIIGNHRTIPLIATLEEVQPLKDKTEKDIPSVIAPSTETSADDPKGAINTAKKPDHWALLTRRAHRFHGRLITLLSGNHDSSIEGGAGYVTRQLELKSLIQHFQPENYFPSHLQVLFEVTIVNPDLEPYIDQVTVKKATKLQ